MASNPKPSQLFDLLDWKLTLPTDDDNNGKADEQKEIALSQGYDSSYFYIDDNGGLVFKTPPSSATTSNSSYPRTELREMLRRGGSGIPTSPSSSNNNNQNNWVFSSTSSSAQSAAGGVNGTLTATLSVNRVTNNSGDINRVGRIIIGQIHATDEEPLLLIYRKLPNKDKGSLYIEHETVNGNNDPNNPYPEPVVLVGSADNEPTDLDLENGIALDEKFSYIIQAQNNSIEVTILRDGKANIVRTLDIADSGYDDDEQYMYFKAGVYVADNSSDPNDYAQATFYALDNKHSGYNPAYTNQTINGTDNSDSLFGQDGNDSITDNKGNDFIDGKGGNDTLRGGFGKDTLIGGLGNDSLLGWSGKDFLSGELGNDRLLAGSGADTLSGGAGNDYLSGYGGYDILAGDNGNDTLNGGSGKDTLTGGLGRDVLNGGGGSDHIVFTSTEDSISSNPDRVKGHDYADVFNLSEMNYSGFEYDSTANTPNLDSEILRYYHYTTGSGEQRTYITDDSSDFEFYVVGHKTFYSNDFLFS